ncbi:MAG: glycosyltransferase [Chloroflexi bacterium]|nr:MAG: glycosyltransferase [Chloroflexota bacterium]
MSPKRILLISRCPPYPIHLGDRLIIWHLVRHLIQRGHTVDLLAFANRPQDWQEVPQYAPFFRLVELYPEPRRTPLNYLQRAFFPAARFPRRANEAWSPQMWEAVTRRLSMERYDVVHLFGGVQVYEFAHALNGQPALITPYESYSLYLRRVVARQRGIKGLAARLQWRFARMYERFMFTPYRRVVVIAEPDRDELLQLNPTLPIEVISNGIDLSFFGYKDTQRDAATLLFVGNYEYAPNVDAALRLAHNILPQVRAERPDARLLLVGNAPPPQVQALASDAIEVTGRVPDVRPYLSRATAFVCPLTLGAGLKNKVLEALAMGCPVVATPLSVDGIAVEHNTSALVAPVEGLAQETLRLLNDKILQRRLSIAGHQLIVSRYSWEQVATRYEQLYDELASSS